MLQYKYIAREQANVPVQIESRGRSQVIYESNIRGGRGREREREQSRLGEARYRTYLYVPREESISIHVAYTQGLGGNL